MDTFEPQCIECRPLIQFTLDRPYVLGCAKLLYCRDVLSLTLCHSKCILSCDQGTVSFRSTPSTLPVRLNRNVSPSIEWLEPAATPSRPDHIRLLLTTESIVERHSPLVAGRRHQSRASMHLNSINDDVSSRGDGYEVVPVESIELEVNEVSDHATLPVVLDVEEEALLNGPAVSVETTVKTPLEAPAAPQTKVLFLDGVRGLAAILVVLEHARDCGPGLVPGYIGVDIFFVLSSFLLTWLFMKKSMKLLAQGANRRTWRYVMADYFQKRFLRVYPLFFVLVIILALMSTEDQEHYFTSGRPPFNVFRTLIFEFEYRYHVFWSLPLEIAYYFVIPVFVLAVLGMRRLWWVGALPLTVWVVYEGFHTIRLDHMPMRPHVSTFLTGSLAAVVFVKVDLWMKEREFVFHWWHAIVVRAVEWLTIGILLSVSFHGLLFTWVHQNPAPPIGGFPYTSALIAVIIVLEILRPSWVSAAFEWNVLRYCGKISFSVYLMHSFVLENTTPNSQPYYYDRLFSRLVLISILATVTYYLVEYPSLLLAQRISKYLAEQEKKALVGVM